MVCALLFFSVGVVLVVSVLFLSFSFRIWLFCSFLGFSLFFRCCLVVFVVLGLFLTRPRIIQRP